METMMLAQALACPPGPIVLPTGGHTERDAKALVDAGVDVFSTQPREWPTACWCGALTWHQSATCDEHYVAPHAARKAVQA